MAAVLYLLQHAESLAMVQSCQLPPLPMLDFFSCRTIAKQPRPRTMATHLKYERLPAQFLGCGAKIVLLLRNPKDVAVSFFYHLQRQVYLRNQQSWDHFLKCFVTGNVMCGSFFDYLDGWQQVITEKTGAEILVVYYEDLVYDCYKELKRIQQFLRLNHNDDKLEGIANRCAYGRMQHDITTGKLQSTLRNVDGTSILLRKGQVGDWRNHFTREQNKAFEKMCREKLTNSIFKFRYENHVAKL